MFVGLETDVFTFVVPAILFVPPSTPMLVVEAVVVPMFVAVHLAGHALTFVVPKIVLDPVVAVIEFDGAVSDVEVPAVSV